MECTERQEQRMSNRRPGDTASPWRLITRAKLVRAAANADPDTRCVMCGELGRAWDTWVAGRTPDGDLVPEHRSCSSSAGAKLLQQRRQASDQAGDSLPTTSVGRLPVPSTGLEHDGS
jgi:hypothetical protein